MKYIQPIKMEKIECFEMSAYNNQTPGKYPKEYTQDSKHGESFKSRKILSLLNVTFLVNSVPRIYLGCWTGSSFVLHICLLYLQTKLSCTAVMCSDSPV